MVEEINRLETSTSRFTMDRTVKFSRDVNGYSLWRRGNFLQVCFESHGCRFHKSGYCIMCDYGSGKNLTDAKYREIFRHVIQDNGLNVERILLGSCGSILDAYEFSRGALLSIVDEVSRTSIRNIIFETHYTTVSDELLAKIKEMLPDRNLSIELGFESSNVDVLQRLNKYMNISDLVSTIDIIKQRDYGVILNVLLGAPGLDVSGQINDTLESIHWAYNHGADEVVIFPMNLKPGTKLWDIWKNRGYNQPYLCCLVELLSRLDDDELSRTSISWFGDRQASGVDIDIIPPITCFECRDRLIKFGVEFMSDFNLYKRRALIADVLENIDCPFYLFGWYE